MRVQEAKTFLVEQTAEQAARERVSFSELEKRMMYFTESKDAVEDPISLNEEFEAEYDTVEYEKKVSGLMRRAHTRLKKEDPEKLRQWDAAVHILQKGDHYILVLCGDLSTSGSPQLWRLYALVISGVVVFLVLGRIFLRGRHSPALIDRYLPTPNEHVMQVLFLAVIVIALIPKSRDKVGEWLSRLVVRLIGEK